jgi:hypothetical protein
MSALSRVVCPVAARGRAPVASRNAQAGAAVAAAYVAAAAAARHAGLTVRGHQHTTCPVRRLMRWLSSQRCSRGVRCVQHPPHRRGRLHPATEHPQSQGPWHHPVSPCLPGRQLEAKHHLVLSVTRVATPCHQEMWLRKILWQCSRVL